MRIQNSHNARQVVGRRFFHVGRSLLGYLVVVLYCSPAAHAGSNAVIWEHGDQIVQLVRQDDDSAPPNDHPMRASPQEIAAMLDSLRLRYVDDEPDAIPVLVFTAEEMDNLGNAIAAGLGRATPSQDLIFHVIGERRLSRGSFARRNRVSAGRVFYRDGSFNIIFGQVQTPHRKKIVYGQIEKDFYPRNYGSRTTATEHEVTLLANSAVRLYESGAGVRDDWIVVDRAAAMDAQPDFDAQPSQPEESARATVRTAQTRAVAPVPTQATGATATQREDSNADAPMRGVEERLKELKRLHELELISDEAYQARMKEILRDL